MSEISSKIKETISFDDDKLIIKKTHDANQMFMDAQYARETVEHKFAADKVLVGTIDAALISVWLKEAGVSWHDTEARQNVIKKKLMSNEFSKLRVWEGKF